MIPETGSVEDLTVGELQKQLVFLRAEFSKLEKTNAALAEEINLRYERHQYLVQSIMAISQK